MPFIPLDPGDLEHCQKPCTSSEHNPPSHMVIYHPCKWQCPACGYTVVLHPSTISLVNNTEPSNRFDHYMEYEYARL